MAGQLSMDSHWDHYTLADDSLGKINIHVARSENTGKKPLILYLEGSGSRPLFYIRGDGKLGTGTTLNAEDYANDYYVALISKPGIPFIDTLKYSPSGRAYYPTNDRYTKSYSLYWRAGAGSRAIDYLISKLPVDTTRIIVMGHSEGAQVAPAVAVLNGHVTHLIMMMGNALNQLYDFLVEARLQVEKGEITATQGQITVDSLYSEYEKIYKNPGSTSDYWFGETNYKWSSFTLQTPLEHMLKLDIPIFYIAGGRDENQTIIDMDYARLEFMRRGKTNLTYKVYPTLDHFFQESTNVKGKTEWVDHISEVHRTAIEWAEDTESR